MTVHHVLQSFWFYIALSASVVYIDNRAEYLSLPVADRDNISAKPNSHMLLIGITGWFIVFLMS